MIIGKFLSKLILPSVSMVFLTFQTPAHLDISYRTLYSFSVEGPEGQTPIGGLLQGNDGNLYGMSAYGGFKFGTVFRIDPRNPNAVNSYRTLHSFSVEGSEGRTPVGSLMQGNDGNLYGECASGGFGFGTVFRIDPTKVNAADIYKPIHSFEGPEGQTPVGRLVQGRDGNLYGECASGGNRFGTVFQIDPRNPDPKTNLRTLHSFSVEGSEGQMPVGGLVLGKDGNLYGECASGGFGFGTVFRIDPTKVNADDIYKPIHSFSVEGSEGHTPVGGLVLGSGGNLYGECASGGFGFGTVFRIDPTKVNADDIYKPIHSFEGPEGQTPDGGLLQSTDGNLYGECKFGGFGFGTIFQIDPTNPDPKTAYRTLHSLSVGGAEGQSPIGGLVQDISGNLYGECEAGGFGFGTVFQIDPRDQDVADSYRTLHSFSSSGDEGHTPTGGLVRGRDQAIYGTCLSGGFGFGTVFSTFVKTIPATPPPKQNNDSGQTPPPPGPVGSTLPPTSKSVVRMSALEDCYFGYTESKTDSENNAYATRWVTKGQYYDCPVSKPGAILYWGTASVTNTPGLKIFSKGSTFGGSVVYGP